MIERLPSVDEVMETMDLDHTSPARRRAVRAVVEQTLAQVVASLTGAGRCDVEGCKRLALVRGGVYCLDHDRGQG